MDAIGELQAISREHEERLKKLERLTTSLVVNVCVIVDKLDGNSKISDKKLRASLKRDRDIALEILNTL